MFSRFFHSYFLAQIVGMYFLIMAIIMLARVNFYRRIITGLTGNYGTIVVAASFALIVGLIMVLTHNFWLWTPHVMVTIVGWLILIKAILWLSIPDTMAAISKQVFNGVGYYVAVAIMAIIAIILLTSGFYPLNPNL
ncbi:hypothetical protein [Legionella jordanis]|uniref:Integral membrane protein (PIN domain superfamily) n=1 Tax=Legionella jordanis TaxID=456 RepID=A0A0W0VFY8_9GAMM|nr:hypothetical protein [Legionella jordanis]KTD19025.1 Integral membrane protein (PIN domain superfamily) [Legionella jordanis]RMX05416.1 hypothetical protein EAW55_01830 [Legionella jordanis]RMX19098.1 hypothetical protein EAS68_06580 [Legionella jordanis]VEH13127.1 Integral membrane protein (PIN domain superfamily) [Legionella jordanis]HAT8714787.1 hypothetical protein [Legionella jordanis]